MAIVGSPPTGYQALLIKASDSLAPDKALASLDSTARLVIASVALVASVLTGFGLFTDVAARLREDPGLLAWPVGLAIAGAVLAMLSLVPWLGRVDVDDLNSVQRRFTSQLIVRGVLVFLALGLLIAAVGLAAFGTSRYLSASGVSQPVLSLSRNIGASTTVAVSAKASRAPTGATAELVVVSDDDEAIVYQATQIVGSAGDVDLSGEIAEASAAGSITATLTVSHGGDEVLNKTATLAAP